MTDPCIDLPACYRSEAFAEDLLDLPPPRPAPAAAARRPAWPRWMARLAALPPGTMPAPAAGLRHGAGA